jgi:hypothetical protein
MKAAVADEKVEGRPAYTRLPADGLLDRCGMERTMARFSYPSTSERFREVRNGPYYLPPQGACCVIRVGWREEK